MLIKSQLLSVMSGSLDASVAAHNRFGRYLRAKVIPTNPNTVGQQAVRAALATLTAAWNSDLTNEQRADWTTYAANVSTTNRVGDTIFLTGLNHYVRSNVPRIRAGLATVDDGPVNLSLPTFTPVSATADASDGEIKVTFTDTDAWATEVGAAMLVQHTAPQPPTVNFNALPYRYAGQIAGASPAPTSPADITAAFDLTNHAGNIVFVRVRVTLADGRLSGVQELRVVIGS